jgi:DNA-binding CsgD family transcriptional regulator
MRSAKSFLTLDAPPADRAGQACARDVSAARLVGRDLERAVLAGMLADLPLRGAALVVRGEPGIGKSALVAEAVRAAARQGTLVLSASGVQSEADLPFAGLHQLLRPVMTCLDRLPPRQQTALGAAFGTADTTTPEPFLIALAALQLLSEVAAARGPVVLIAEDAQWLDRPTADALAFIARRVESDPFLLLTAIRDGYDSTLLTARLPELRLEGLDGKASRELLDTRFPFLAPATRRRVLAEARGNPLGLIELPAALGPGATTAALPARLPLTKRLEQAFAARAAELAPVIQTLLLIAAADDSSALAQVLKATSIAFGAEPTVSDLVPAIEAHLIDADGQAIRFRHPLIRSAVYQAASVASRHAAHAALAEVLTDEPDRQAWHRAAAAVGPDPTVAAELEEAAWRARKRGGIITAAAAFERAAAFTPDPARRGALLLRAAEAARELGRSDLVTRLLREADSHPLTSRERAQSMWLGDTLGHEPVGDPARVRALVETARHTASAGDTTLALSLLSAAAFRCYWADLRGPEAAEVLHAAGHAGASPGDPLLLQIEAYTAPIARGIAVLDSLASTAPPDDPEALYLLGTAACLAGDYHQACSLLGTSAATLREHGRLRVLTHVLAVRAWAATMTSNFRVAMPAAQEAGRLAAETGQPLWEAGTWTARAVLAALRGEQDAVRDLTARVETIMLPARAAEPLSLVQYARGLLALGQGRHADAYAQLHRMYEPGDPAHNHRNLCGAIGDLAEAAIRSGHRDRAREILERLRPRGEPAPWLRAATRYADALLADDEHAEDVYQEVLRRDLYAWPFMQARLQLAFGEWLRRQRRPADSRAHLRAARDAFDALGTAPWSERARRELRASGENSRCRAPDTIDRLTPQELQIIQLASEGLSNREIGQRLYLSHRTVESHLYRVFPKLGIRSRAQLGKVLGELPQARTPLGDAPGASIPPVAVRSPD